ncbi:hypothetical protein G3I43_35030, partial [Streptomyces anulatus]|nr:hypothetical protein [Streptomyces anulatus]
MLQRIPDGRYRHLVGVARSTRTGQELLARPGPQGADEGERGSQGPQPG